METFSILHTRKGHTDWIREVDISSNNKYVALASYDGSYKLALKLTEPSKQVDRKNKMI